MKNITIKQFLPGIAWFFLVSVLLFLPGNDLPDTGPWFNFPQFDKLVHIGLFGVLTFLFNFPIFKSNLKKQEKLHWLIRIALAACVWGITSEFIQKFFVPNRSFDLLDWTADSIGIFIIFLAFLLKISKA